ncbi:hypothetical protein AAK913_14670 [Enterococcus faecium]|uniref:hypothetical protein n=1 Tax=Enterococcus faecium TaxID=1352 RepID=UPI00351772CF
MVGISTLGCALVIGNNSSQAAEKNMSNQTTITEAINEKDLGNWEMGKETDEEAIAEEKEYFQKKYGYENKFYTLEKEDQFLSCVDEDCEEKLKEEFNPVTGILRVTDEMTGEVEEQNHYEDIKPIKNATPNFN